MYATVRSKALVPVLFLFCEALGILLRDIRRWVLPCSMYSCLFMWAGPWENVSYFICEQQRRRPACASADYSRNFQTLASFCGCAGRFLSYLVGNSRRHILSCRGSYVSRIPYCLSCMPYFVYVFSSPWCHRLAKTYDGGTPWTFHLTFFLFLLSI